LQALQTRDEIRPFVSHLCSRNACPTEGDYSKAIHVLRYLVSTPGVGRVFDASFPEFSAHADAGFALFENGCSSGGYFLSVGSGAPFECHAKCQDSVAPDPMASEYYNANSACLDISHYRQFATQLGWPPTGPTILHLDCKTAINLAEAPEVTRKARHMQAKHHYIRELVDTGIVKLKHVPADLMRADILTKVFSRAEFLRRRAMLLNCYVGVLSYSQSVTTGLRKC